MKTRPFILSGIVIVATLLVSGSAWPDGHAGPGDPPYKVSEIARGSSWVSPYWGYSTPKIVDDRGTYYTAGLWGDKPESAYGQIYVYRGTDSHAWSTGARLPDMYQPATLLLDKERRLIVAYTRSDKPIRLMRAKASGNVDDFDELPAPPDMKNAYYIGVAIHGDTVYIAYISTPNYTMYLAQLDLVSKSWTPSIVMREGQVDHKPKTAWTYPILWPTDKGLHVVASNCPDGGDGNTYNEVCYQFYPKGAAKPAIDEKDAISPIGKFAYAMDALVDDAGAVHTVFMWNIPKYGDPAPADAPAPGIYHGYRDPATGKWSHTKVGESGLAGFYLADGKLQLMLEKNGTFVPAEWKGPANGWKELPPLCNTKSVPPPSFMDVINTASGSKPSGVLIVTDGLLPAVDGKPQQRVLWSVMPND